MRRTPLWKPLALLVALAAITVAGFAAADTRFPPRFAWETVAPEEAGFDAEGLAEAVAFARERAESEPADLNRILLDTYTGREPNYRVLGPTKPRAGDSGMILSEGKIVAQWGDIHRVDMTFSVVKSYLSTLAALAVERGLIESLHDPVGEYVTDGKFAGDHNSKITWHHLLQQTSDWSGTLWDTPDWADRPVGDNLEEWRNREMHEPGTHLTNTVIDRASFRTPDGFACKARWRRHSGATSSQLNAAGGFVRSPRRACLSAPVDCVVGA